MTRRRAVRSVLTVALAVAAVGAGLLVVAPLRAQDKPAVPQGPGPGEAWRSSPHHGQLNGATGRPIPCLCRFQGRDYRLGESVCMNTHIGTVIARCDLNLNNTTWVPTDEQCTISLAPADAGPPMSRPPRSG